MGAQYALTKHNHAASENIRAFHGNTDGQALIGTAKKIAWPEADAMSTVHIHCMVHYLAHALGHLVFHNAGNYRRTFASVQAAQGQFTCRVHDVTVAGNFRQRFFHTFKITDRGAELFTNACIGAAVTGNVFARAGAQCRQ